MTMVRRVVVVGMVVLGACGEPMPAQLEVFVPTLINSDGTAVLSVLATNDDGSRGTGTVTLSAEFGALDATELQLSNGAGSTSFRCDPASESRCESNAGVQLTATWGGLTTTQLLALKPGAVTGGGGGEILPPESGPGGGDDEKPGVISSSGFFVLTATAWNGNLGGLAGANAKCLDELTRTSWRGKSNALLDESTVRAFLCDGVTCNRPRSSTWFNFAAAGSPSVGGATFLTDSTGRGPNYTDAWHTSKFFGITAEFWSNRELGNVFRWGDTPAVEKDQHCKHWSSGDASEKGIKGLTSKLGVLRWNDGAASCSGTRKLVCFVNPPF